MTFSLMKLCRRVSSPADFVFRQRRFWILTLSCLQAAPLAFAQLDYPAAHWNPVACPKYYTTGNGKSFCVIHDMEGYYEASISYLNRCYTDTSWNDNVAASVH